MKHCLELKSKDLNKESAIIYKCYLKGVRFAFGVGLKIYPGLWDQTTQRPVADKAIIKEYKKEIPDVETRIKNIKVRIENICNGVDSFISNAELNNSEINLTDLRSYLDEKVVKSKRIVGKVTRGKGNGLNLQAGEELKFIRNYVPKFIQEIRNGKRTIRSGHNSNKRYTYQTIKNYSSFYNQWLDFEKAQRAKYTWDDLGLGLYNEIVHYCNTKKYKWDTVGKLIKHLKVIAQAAKDDGIHNNQSFRDYYFKVLKSKIENIALTFEEVKRLENLDLNNNLGWDKARDIFLMGCYTALRFSDLKRLRKEHFQDRVLSIINQKTKAKVNIPIKAKMKQLIKKYAYQAPKISEQKVNEYIKVIAQMAEINELIEKREVIGGETKIRTALKYELITTHTARRTAATHMYLLKMLPIDIMAITGHTTESSFLKYICLPKEEAVKRMAGNEFFK